MHPPSCTHTHTHTHLPRLYDSVETMEMVKKWVGFYNTYRDILISDIVHVRRPDMQGKGSAKQRIKPAVYMKLAQAQLHVFWSLWYQELGG